MFRRRNSGRFVFRSNSVQSCITIPGCFGQTSVQSCVTTPQCFVQKKVLLRGERVISVARLQFRCCLSPHYQRPVWALGTKKAAPFMTRDRLNLSSVCSRQDCAEVVPARWKRFTGGSFSQFCGSGSRRAGLTGWLDSVFLAEAPACAGQPIGWLEHLAKTIPSSGARCGRERRKTAFLRPVRMRIIHRCQVTTTMCATDQLGIQ